MDPGTYKLFPGVSTDLCLAFFWSVLSSLQSFLDMSCFNYYHVGEDFLYLACGGILSGELSFGVK